MEWNCKCSFRPTDKPTTDVPGAIKEVPQVFRNNPGKTAVFVKLSEHPYLKGKGVLTCPECRRQGFTQNISNADDFDQLCPAHQMVALIEERRRKFRELDADPNYIDVAFNPDNGALKATHIGHNFDRKKGWYEKKVQEVGYKAGHEVILENERFGKKGERFTEGTWNGKKFEIAAAETGIAKNIRKNSSIAHLSERQK